jgi:hypothetical protein
MHHYSFILLWTLFCLHVSLYLPTICDTSLIQCQRQPFDVFLPGWFLMDNNQTTLNSMFNATRDVKKPKILLLSHSNFFSAQFLLFFYSISIAYSHIFRQLHVNEFFIFLNILLCMIFYSYTIFHLFSCIITSYFLCIHSYISSNLWTLHNS